MSKTRLEAFSDGVLAIIITIMVLEMKVPHGSEFEDIKPLLPVFLSYILSFIYVGIYWNNHHHLLQATRHVNGGALWANLHLLFWLSLLPFTTAWMGENKFAPLPTAVYGGVLLLAGVAYWNLQRTLLKQAGLDSVLGHAVKTGVKEWSILLYAAAIPLAFWRPWIADVLYVTVAMIWLLPDRRIEKAMAADGETTPRGPMH